MSGFSNGLIRLNTNPAGVFYSGQVISGSVVFDLDQPLTFYVLEIKFLGEANVLWTENEIEKINGVERNKTIKYCGREEYFNYTQPLAGGSGKSQLPSGGQSFPFKFQIPFTAPSSFKGEQGSVTYYMTAHVIHAYPGESDSVGGMTEELRKNFEVIAPFDLNLGSPRIRQPIDLEFEEVYGCDCFCSPDPVTIRVRLPVSGYCPGQVIPVAVEVKNESSVEITKMIFQIVSKELYRSQRPQSEYILPEKVLMTTKKGPVLAKCKRNFTCDLMVPEIIPPYLENCGIIDVGYFFRITIKLSGCNDELQDEAEICLGLVPVREFTEGEYVHPLAHSLPTGPIPDPSTAPQLVVPPVASGFNGSNTSLHKIQYNSVQTAAHPNNPPPYQGGNPPYPGGNPPYPGGYLPYPGGNPPYPGGNPPYPGGNPPLPGGNPPYPGGNPPYPGGNPPYPGGNPPYPGGNPPYPGGNPPYPGGNPPYSLENRFQTAVSMEQKPKPYNDYEVGFKATEGTPAGGMPYPSNPSVVNPPPYPRENLMPGVAQPPYPTDNMMPRVNSGLPPYAEGGFAPSAPPPN